MIVSMMGEPSATLAKKYDVVVVGQMTDGTTERLKRLADLVDSGKVKPQVDRVFKFDKIREAFTYQETGHPRGKVLLEI